MILFILRILLIILLTISLLLTDGNSSYYNRFYSRFILWCFGIRKIEIYGKLNPKARVLAFNHPTQLDAFIMGSFIPYLGGLVRRSTVSGIFLSKLTQSVLVSKSGGEQTAKRLKQAIYKHKKYKYAIPINTLDCKNNSLPGIIKGVPLPKFKTIPFVLDEVVQPILIVYDSPDYTLFKVPGVVSNLMRPIQSFNNVRVYLLPSDFKRADETIDDFVKRTKERMTWCLEKDWERPECEITPEEQKQWNQSSYIYLSLLFCMIGIFALFKSYYEQGLMWIALALITVFYHNGQMSSMYWLEKVLIALIVTKILFRYVQMKRLRV
jgi:hypothetical protein